ncbi:hypothetical protein BDW74DRAFT_178976 [Aspergillus multicolor]|uniref:uncharacterized protein n=1 Tax=Aspergillus multicolor TaxID=41759 RepID=UPI003CCCE720
MFCPCARSYFAVEGLQTETPRLVRSKDRQAPSSSFRAPLPMQIRPLSTRGELQQTDYGQAQGPGKVPAILITPIPEEPELADAQGKVQM